MEVDITALTQLGGLGAFAAAVYHMLIKHLGRVERIMEQQVTATVSLASSLAKLAALIEGGQIATVVIDEDSRPTPVEVKPVGRRYSLVRPERSGGTGAPPTPASSR